MGVVVVNEIIVICSKNCLHWADLFEREFTLIFCSLAWWRGSSEIELAQRVDLVDLHV